MKIKDQRAKTEDQRLDPQKFLRPTQTTRNKNAELVLFDCQRNENIVNEIRFNALKV